MVINWKKCLCAVVSVVLLAGCASESENKRPVDANTLPAPKFSLTEARQSVLATHPGTTVSDGTAEPWKGKLFWMFDVTTPGTQNITEVAVDQQSGKIVWTNVETPADRAKEMEEEKLKK